MDSSKRTINERMTANTVSSSKEQVEEETQKKEPCQEKEGVEIEEGSNIEQIVSDDSENNSNRDKSWYLHKDGTINFDRVKEDPSGMNGIITREDVFDGLYNSLGPIWNEDDRTEDLRKSNRYLDEDNKINFDKIREDFCGLEDIVRRNEIQNADDNLRNHLGIESETTESEQKHDSEDDNNDSSSESLTEEQAEEQRELLYVALLNSLIGTSYNEENDDQHNQETLLSPDLPLTTPSNSDNESDAESEQDDNSNSYDSSDSSSWGRMDRDEHSALIDNMRSMYFGPNNSNSIRDLCYTMGDNMRDDDSQNQWLSDCSSDSDDEPDPHPYCDASGNKIRETISQKNQRITGRSSHFLPLPLDFNRNEVIVDISKMGKSSRYGVRIENDEEGNPVYQEQHGKKKFIFKKLPYGPKKLCAWSWFNKNVNLGLEKCKEKYKQEKNMLDFEFNPYDGNDIKDTLKTIIFKEQPSYMVWALTLPEMINRFYDVPLPEDMSDIEKVRTVFGHFFFDPRYCSILHTCIKEDLINFVKWIFNELDYQDVKKIDTEKYGMEYFDNACTHESELSAKFLIDKYPHLDVARNNSYAMSCILSNYNITLAEWLFNLYPDTLLSGKNASHVILQILNSWTSGVKYTAIHWIHSIIPDIDIYDPEFDIFIATYHHSLDNPEDFSELLAYYEKNYPIPPERYQEIGTKIIVYCIGTGVEGFLQTAAKYFSNLDFRYNNDQAMIAAIKDGDSSDVEFIQERVPGIQFFDKDKRFYEEALDCNEDDILLYMLKYDQKNNDESLYKRHPEICDTIFTTMSEVYGSKSPFFIETLNPPRYLLTLNQFDMIVEHKIVITKEEFKKIGVEDLPSKITECIICHENKSNLYTECGHMYCYDCLTSWLSENSSCPYCRKTIITQNICFIQEE